MINRAENEPPRLDTPATLNRMIIEASERCRRIINAADTDAKAARALKASAELARLLELRLALSGVIPTGPGRPRNPPGRPAADNEHQDHEHPGVYEVAAALRAALLELPDAARAGAAEILADAFPALLAEPREAPALRPAAPAHLKPGRDAPPPWVRQQWQR